MFDITPGALLFYGGIIGIVIVVIISGLIVISLMGSKRKLKKIFKDEYSSEL